jgi:hypothetical protein
VSAPRSPTPSVQLTTEKNTAYYVIGTKDELVKQGILVEEGRKRFLLVGGRSVRPRT